jgi:erythronate-4-phosphate dehydrogenase
VALGTPHIAGYSYDGKVNGTTMIYRAACDALGAKTDWDPTPLMPPSFHARLALNAAGRADEDVLREAVLTVYDIEADDRRLRAMAGLPDGERVAYFDRLRKEYPQRREFQNTTIALAGGSDALRARLTGIGFRVE